MDADENILRWSFYHQEHIYSDSLLANALTRSALQRPVAVLLLNRKTDLYTVEHQAAHTLCKQAVGQPWLQCDARGGPGVVVRMRIIPSLPPVDCQ